MVTVVRRDQLQPSYHQGYAKNAGESDHPWGWVDLQGLWIPELGPTGTRLWDLSGHGADGVSIANGPAATAWVTHKGLYAIDCDGVNDQITIDTPLDRIINGPATSDFTIYGWGSHNTSSSDDITFYCETNTEDNNPFTSLTIRETGGNLALVVAHRDDAAVGLISNAINITSKVTIGEWFDAALVVSGTNYFAYTMGDEVESGTFTGLGTTTLNRSSFVNRDRPAGNFMLGKLGQQRVYRRALSAVEIREIHNDPFGIVRLPRRVWARAPVVVDTSLSFSQRRIHRRISLVR